MLLTLGQVAALPAQVRTPTYDSLQIPGLELSSDSAQTPILGASISAASGSGEALDATGIGFGLSVSAGYSFGALTELRLGGTASSHADELVDASVRLYGLFVENLYKRRVSSFIVHGGLRIVWMWESREIYTNVPNGPGIGLFVGGRYPINPRISLEANGAFTSISFSGADIEGAPDVDRQAAGTVWDVRFGLVYHLKVER